MKTKYDDTRYRGYIIRARLTANEYDMFQKLCSITGLDNSKMLRLLLKTNSIGKLYQSITDDRCDDAINAFLSLPGYKEEFASLHRSVQISRWDYVLKDHISDFLEWYANDYDPDLCVPAISQDDLDFVQDREDELMAMTGSPIGLISGGDP